jgi:hypothetical protein
MYFTGSLIVTNCLMSGWSCATVDKGPSEYRTHTFVFSCWAKCEVGLIHRGGSARNSFWRRGRQVNLLTNLHLSRLRLNLLIALGYSGCTNIFFSNYFVSGINIWKISFLAAFWFFQKSRGGRSLFCRPSSKTGDCLCIYLHGDCTMNTTR